MKVALILLGLFAITFALVVGSGAARTDEQTSGGWFGKAPPVSASGEPDRDSLEGWEVPPLAPLLARFAPPIRVSALEARVPAYGATDLTVAPSKAEYQVARLTLAEGTAARVSSAPADEGTDGAAVCLCREGALAEVALFAGCGSRWLSDRRASMTLLKCRAGDEKSSLIFGRLGGRLSFAAGASAAQVSVR